MYGEGIGKPRSMFGRWLDGNKITQLSLERATGLSRGTISSLCNDDGYIPSMRTAELVKEALEALGYVLPEGYLRNIRN